VVASSRVAIALSALILVGCAPKAELNLLIVDASGMRTELTWQPTLATPDLATATMGGCESHSLNLDPGQAWSVSRDGVVLAGSDTLRPAAWSGMIAIEVHLLPDGSVSALSPRSVTQEQDAPDPGCGLTP
jgi:hypothetical protein